MKLNSIQSAFFASLVLRVCRWCTYCRRGVLCLSLCAPLFLAGCQVYKIDVQQGNEINADMLAEVKIGMSKTEVGAILGFPLLNDPFHADRWDYYFYLKEGTSEQAKQQSATLNFVNDQLAEIRSELLNPN